MKKAVFIDCDGILNELYPKSPRGIPQSVDQFKLMPGIMPLLKKLRKAGLLREATITHSELNLSASFVVSTRWQIVSKSNQLEMGKNLEERHKNIPRRGLGICLRISYFNLIFSSITTFICSIISSNVIVALTRKRAAPRLLLFFSLES